MKKLSKSNIFIILIPIVMLLGWIGFNYFNQPDVLDISLQNAGSKSYFDENQLYRLTGDYAYTPLLYLDENSLSEDSDLFMEYLYLPNIGFTISSLSEIKSEDSIYVDNDNYQGTIFFFLNLPVGNEYSLCLPATFCDYNVFVNNKLVVKSNSYKNAENNPDKKIVPYFPDATYVILPKTDDGIYSIAISVKSPVNFVTTEPDTILFGTKDILEVYYNSSNGLSLFVSCFIIISIIFCLIHFIAIRHEKSVLSFIGYSLALLLHLLTTDDVIIMSYIPTLPYYIGIFLKDLSTPLLIVSVIILIKTTYSEYLSEKRTIIACCLEAIPLISSLCLERISILSTLSLFAVLASFTICILACLKATFFREEHAATHTTAVLLTLVGIILHFSSRFFPMPAKYTDIIGYLTFCAIEIRTLAKNYARVSSQETFMATELSDKLEAMQASENAFLNAQMKPHFLYNTLNTIADLCVTDPEKAKSLIKSLEEYLKLILSLDNMDETVTLRRELELATAYTDIEKERFPSINFYYDLPMRLPNIMMPPITLQPLIENAIKHGVRKSNKPGVVTLRVVDTPFDVYFYVSDNGVGMTEDIIAKLFEMPKENKSIGIYNIDKRLKNLYKEGLAVESTVGLGTCISFSVPKY